MTMRSIRYFLSEFRVQRASCLRPKEASNSFASAASFGTQSTVYRIGWRAQRALFFVVLPKAAPNCPANAASFVVATEASTELSFLFFFLAVLQYFV